MGHKFAEIAFTNAVKKVQVEEKSRIRYAQIEQGTDFNDSLSQKEIDFIESRDSFYMASVSETHWPYVQHRGGPVGFLKVLAKKTIGFADFKGNRQYISTGNLRQNNKVALILVDYPNQMRMKILGRIREINKNNIDLFARFDNPNYRARNERAFCIDIEAFDWNCPQHITPRYSMREVKEIMHSLEEKNLLSKTKKENKPI